MDPLRKQRVQTLTRLTLPEGIWARTFCRLGLKRRLVLLLAWLTLNPTWGVLPHISHVLAIKPPMGSDLFLEEARRSFLFRLMLPRQAKRKHYIKFQ
jgi:hypothetical protein